MASRSRRRAFDIAIAEAHRQQRVEDAFPLAGHVEEFAEGDGIDAGFRQVELALGLELVHPHLDAERL